MKKIYTIGIAGAIFWAAMGELARLPIGPENGLLPNDLWVGGLTLIWLFDRTLLQRRWPASPLWAPFLTFIAFMAISLLHNLPTLTRGEFVSSALYAVRFIEYFLLVFIALEFTSPLKKHLTTALKFGTLLVALAGFVQLKIFPDFGPLEQIGWDPHNGRLLSTWFDPNFVGGLFAVALCWFIPDLLPSKKLSSKIPTALLITILLTALLLTYSRSAYLALLAGLGMLGLLRSKKLILIGALVILLGLSVSDRARERVVNLVHTGQALFGIGAELPDATARLRLNSWNGAWTIIQDQPWLGIGYNSYRAAQGRYGFLDDLTKHSATGSDSTLLTIWATTGLFGLLAYLWILTTMLWNTFKHRENGLSVGIFCSIIAILVHSLFVNSLLYTPLLVFLYIALGLSSPIHEPKPRRITHRNNRSPTHQGRT